MPRGLVLDAMFQFTPVVRRATSISRSLTPFQRSFNSRPSCDGRLEILVHETLAAGFNSRPSCDGRHRQGFLSRTKVEVSIHARRATGDQAGVFFTPLTWFQFTPVVRRATPRPPYTQTESGFQFTPVVRRATANTLPARRSFMFQFTPVVRRAT